MVENTKYFSDEIFGFHAQQAIEKPLLVIVHFVRNKRNYFILKKT